jgi:hypothetical protein
MAVHTQALTGPDSGLLLRWNTSRHELGLWLFLGVALAHWGEHLVQAFQIWVLDMPRPESLGVLGYFFPVLVREELLHYAYALIMLAGLVLLLPGMTGRARLWWQIALAIQVFHHLEHLLLFFQSATNDPWFDKQAPTSLLQLMFQRAELHLWYNALVFTPMLVAMYFHRFPPSAERRRGGASSSPTCSCART